MAKKHYVRAKQGQPLTEEAALQLGYALFDAIAKDQAEKTRQADDQDDQDDQEE